MKNNGNEETVPQEARCCEEKETVHLSEGEIDPDEL
jgi:hypothetical protein